MGRQNGKGGRRAEKAEGSQIEPEQSQKMTGEREVQQRGMRIGSGERK